MAPPGIPTHTRIPHGNPAPKLPLAARRSLFIDVDVSARAHCTALTSTA